MQKNKIDELEAVAKQGVEFIVSNEVLVPTILISTSEGVEIISIIANGPNQRDYTLASITKLLKDRDVDAYALVTEGYATKFIDAAKRVGGKIRNLPLEDRFDIASIVLAEKGKTPKLLTSVIDSDKNGIRFLRNWETMDSAKGAFVIEDW